MTRPVGGKLRFGLSWTHRVKSWGIRERVIFVAVAPAAFIAILLAAYLLFLRYADAEKELVERSQSLIKLIAPAAEYGVFSGNREELHRLVARLAQSPDVRSVTLYDRSGTVLAQAGTPALAPDPVSLKEGWSGRGPDEATQVFHAKIWRSALPINDPLTWPGVAPAERDSIGSITLEFSRSGILARKREMMVVTLLATLFTLALGSLLALRLSRDVSAPIIGLQQVVESIRRGRLGTRVQPHPANTLRELEDGINEMAAALETGRDHLEDRIAKATAELQQKKEEAERDNVAKSRFLAATSHDLRQPLHALTLFATELSNKTDQSPLQPLAVRIRSAVDSLGELLDALLDLSRIDLGATRPELASLELDRILQRVVDTHAVSARAKGLDLKLHHTGYWIVSDPLLLYRMVGNLVANAVRYTERGGVLVGARRAFDHVRIEVWDTGIGIKGEHQHLVFQEFFQMGNPERDSRKGLGLGLALVERLSALLGHPVSLRSLPQRGSVFGITVPRSAAPRRDSLRHEPVIGGFDAHVLAITTDDEMWPVLCRQLAAWGCTVDWIDRKEGIQTAPLQLFDLILCDAARQASLACMLRTQEAVDAPPVVVIGEAETGLTDVLPSGRDLRLAKPIQPAKLRALMQHLLAEPQRAAPDIRSAA